MSSETLEIWFDFASTYSHIAVNSIEGRVEGSGVEVIWRPFLLGPVFHHLNGWMDSPFNLQPVKGAYMWKDMERECLRYGVPFCKPSQFPRNSLKAARVALGADGQPWQAAFIREVYLENFFHDREISDVAVLRDVLGRVDCPDVDAALAMIDDQGVKDRLKAQTQEAIDRGVFGAPTFFVRGEMFFGNDRLDQAIALGRA